MAYWEYLDKVVSFDIDKVSLEEPFKKYGTIDVVIHTATEYGRKGKNVSEIVKANLYFPLRLLELATFFKTDTFFNTDTILYNYLNSYSLSKKQFVD